MTVDLTLPGQPAAAGAVRRDDAAVTLTADDVLALHAAQYSQMVGAAYRILGSEVAAEDIVQGAFEVLYRKRAHVRRDTAPAYLYRVVVNAAISYGKRESKGLVLLDCAAREGRLAVESAHAHDGDPEAMLDSEQVREAMRNLPVKDRAVVILHYYHDLPDKEIAAALGEPAARVRLRRHRALQKMKKMLDRGDR